MPISVWACNGCQHMTTVAREYRRFRGSLWCPSCHALAKAGKPTPREGAFAAGQDSRNGLTKMVAAMAGESEESAMPGGAE